MTLMEEEKNFLIEKIRKTRVSDSVEKFFGKFFRYFVFPAGITEREVGTEIERLAGGRLTKWEDMSEEILSGFPRRLREDEENAFKLFIAEQFEKESNGKSYVISKLSEKKFAKWNLTNCEFKTDMADPKFAIEPQTPLQWMLWAVEPPKPPKGSEWFGWTWNCPQAWEEFSVPYCDALYEQIRGGFSGSFGMLRRES